jgi:hypothetical protein
LCIGSTDTEHDVLASGSKPAALTVAQIVAYAGQSGCVSVCRRGRLTGLGQFRAAARAGRHAVCALSGSSFERGSESGYELV